jgi:HEAT repeat protein
MTIRYRVKPYCLFRRSELVYTDFNYVELVKIGVIFMLNQEQERMMPADVGGRRAPTIITRNLLISALVGLSVAVMLTLMLGVAVFLPLHLLSHISLLLISTLVESLLFSVLAFFAARPFALYLYFRAVHEVQKKYYDVYTPLTALTNFRKKTHGGQDVPTGRDTAVPWAEHVSLLDLVAQQETHQFILGGPGAGKTMALRVYQFLCSQRPFSLALRGSKLPILVLMKNYSLFLKQQAARQDEHRDGLTDDDLLAGLVTAQPSLLSYLEHTNEPGMRHLRPYIATLFEQGRLLLLCDGLNEIDSYYQAQVSQELVHLMRETNNRLVITCREVDYREQEELVQLVDDGLAARAEMSPLDPAQVQEFVARSIERQSERPTYTTAEVMTAIERSRLRYHCTNPMMLFTLMEIIDHVGVERSKQVDTRGGLLREWVRLSIDNEREQWSQKNQSAPATQEVLRFLSEVACAARWANDLANDRNGIQLRGLSVADTAGGARGRHNFDALGDELKYWLSVNLAQSPSVLDNEPFNAPYDDMSTLLQFAQSADLIDINPDGVLSFHHDLIAEYFVAEYFTTTIDRSLLSLTLRKELLEDVGRWSETVAIWAGLFFFQYPQTDRRKSQNFVPLFTLPDVNNITRNISNTSSDVVQGLQQQGSILQALTLGLICVGVFWTPPQADVQQRVILPPAIEEALSIVVRNRAAREELARLFQYSAEEGGYEIYRSLLPLITIDGIDDLLTLLDQQIVPDVLFTQLQDTADDIAYEPQVKRIVRVLGRFGEPVVARAAELSLPAPERSLRLRAAAINTLGWTADAHAVEPLIERLRDSDVFIAQRATNALMRLGPQLTLTRLLAELEERGQSPSLSRVQQAVLAIFMRFVASAGISTSEYQHILEHVVPLLGSHYKSAPEVQEMAGEFLVLQGRATDENAEGRERRGEKVIDALLSYLTSQDEMAVQHIMEVLQEIGAPAVPRVINRLQNSSEVVRVRAVEILSTAHDHRALEPLLQALDDPQDRVWEAAVRALELYAPESIAGLIEQVLTGPNDIVAERATNVLISIGESVVERVIDGLSSIVPGRSRFLVQVLERLRDPRAVPALIALLEQSQLEPLLVVAIIRALCQFADERIIPPLLSILAMPSPLVYEAAINALSQMLDVAFNGLVEALDVPQDTPFTQRVRRVLLLMVPFPGERLLRALEQRRSDEQAHQILLVFQAQGKEAAELLVQNIQHRNELMREYIYLALEQMPGAVVVPALLHAALQPALRKTIGDFLLKYPETAIPALVNLLGERERAPFAVEWLPRFDLAVLRPLITGLNDQRSQSRENAQRVLITLVRQRKDEKQQQALQEVIHLFHPPLPMLARQALLDVLTESLSDISMPALLSGLEDAQLLNDVADAFVRLAQKPVLQEKVLDELVAALYVDERRQGAEIALIRNGGLVVSRIGDLIVNSDPAVAGAARAIMSEIGAPALSFIWTAQSDRSNLSRREAAMTIFRSMPPEVIKDELVELLVSDDRDDIAMAVSLLLARIYEEGQLPYQEQVMVPELIDYVQKSYHAPAINLRIIALLLLLGESAIVDHLLQVLWENPQQCKQLLYVFLLLSPATHRSMLELFDDPTTPPDLKAELATILGITLAPPVIEDYVRNISAYGISVQRNVMLHQEELEIALRSLGGLLAGGHWDVDTLQDLRLNSDGIVREICNVLLGIRYEPQLSKLRQDMQTQSENFKQQLIVIAAEKEAYQKEIREIQAENEKISEEHNNKSEELQHIMRERDMLKVQIARLSKEKNELIREKNEEMEKVKREKDEAMLRYHALQRQLSHVLGSGSSQQDQRSRR